MKLIATVEEIQTAPVPVEVIAHNHLATQIDGRTDHLNRHPAISFTIQAITPLKWESHNLSKPKLSINEGLSEWMDADTAIRNWVYTNLIAFIETKMKSWDCPVPDVFIMDLGVQHVTFMVDGDLIRIMI